MRTPILRMPSSSLFLVAMALLLLVPLRARAIPAFARKYGTSCTTCHTIFPKLTPFGEAFRRTGYRFPGIDGDFIKQEQIPLGQEQNKAQFPKKTWPAILAAGGPFAMFVNGRATIHPDKNAGAAVADNGTAFSLHDLVGEAHLFAADSFTERITYFVQMTFNTAGQFDIENAQVLFNDIGGLKHAFNLSIGKGYSNLTSFGLHSSYVSDAMMAPLGVTALYGARSDSWSVLNNFTGAELSGMIKGRVSYAVGINAGTNIDIRPTENFHGRLGAKIGGMRLDGEGDAGPKSVDRPWEETALTLDAFFYRTASHFTNGAGTPQDDTALVFGGNLRLQLKSFELTSGVYQERHDHALVDGSAVNALSNWNEVSYIVLPWLVPAVRVELSRLEPQGGTAVNDVRITPGVAALIVPNLKAVLSAQLEWASGLAPAGGWGAAGGAALPPAIAKTVTEVESVTLGVAYSM